MGHERSFPSKVGLRRLELKRKRVVHPFETLPERGTHRHLQMGRMRTKTVRGQKKKRDGPSRS